MNKSLRRRVAAVATTATVGGLLLPFLAAGSALAATPTSLTVSPTNAATNTSTAATFTVTAVGGTPTTGVYSQVVTGPDAATVGTPCTPAAGATFTCTVTTGPTPGTDNLRFFYDAASATYTAGDPTATANLTVAGPINKIVLAPATSSVAAGARTTYSATATDAAGRPVPGSTINVTASESNTASVDLEAVSPPVTGTMSTATPTASTTTGTATATAFTGTSSSGTAGVALFSVASRSVGSVAISVLSNSNNAVGSSATLTVNGGTANDVTLVTVAPTTQHAFTSATASVTVNVQNKQGNPVPGVTPVVSVISGPNSGATVTVTGATDANGNTAASYPASATQGQDIVQAFVNYKGGSGGLDTGEPFANVTVNAATPDIAQIVDNGGANGFTVPLNVNSTTITYTVQNNGGSLAGYNLRFAPTSPAPGGLQGTFTLSATSGVTDARGNVSVTVSNANPQNGDKASISASIGTGANLQTDAVVVTYAASAVSASSIKITPFANTTAAQGTASFSVSAADQFGQPATGLSFNWTVSGRNSTTNNAGAQGSGATFSYTDVGAAGSAGRDTVTVIARNGNSVLGNRVAYQYWVNTAATATQANIDLGTAGDYTANNAGLPPGQTGPVVASGFVTSSTTGVTPDPTPGVVPAYQTVLIKLADAANNRLFGKSVSLSSSGVGVFTDQFGKPIGTSTTALVADTNANTIYPTTTNTNDATAYVRSTQTGTQTITATVDGITTSATVTYTGQFVGLTPTRVMDTRTGQGALKIAGSAAPVGPLAPNTSYTLNYGAAGMPVGNYAAYVFNVTAINPSGVGNLRVAPGAGSVTPTTSLINYQSGKDVANSVIVSNAGDALQLYSAASSANVAIDLVGYYPTAAALTSTTPSRIADTRNGASPVAAGETRSFQVAGQGGLPGTTAKAVALNVTVVNPSGLGNLRIFADGDALPTTSNINYIPGQDKSAFVIVNLPANGKISVYSAGTPVDVAIDAYASYDKVTSNIVTQTPVRILDTRQTGNTISSPVNHYLDLQVTGNGGVPANAQAVLVSVTGIHTTGSTGSGNLRVYPSGATVPTISTLNYVSATTDVANFAIVPIGANGKISLDSEGSPIDVAVDVLGYVPAG